MSLTTSFALLTAVSLAVTFLLFWSLGLFADRPPRRRAVYLGIASLVYNLAAPAALVIGRAVDRCAYWFAIACAYVSQHGGVYTTWSLVMFVACTASALRLLTFRRGPSRHRAGYAAASWLIVCSMTATAVKIVFGIQPPPGPAESIGVVAFTWCIFVHRGNLAHVVRHMRAQFGSLLSGRAR